MMRFHMKRDGDSWVICDRREERVVGRAPTRFEARFWAHFCNQGGDPAYVNHRGEEGVRGVIELTGLLQTRDRQLRQLRRECDEAHEAANKAAARAATAEHERLVAKAQVLMLNEKLAERAGRVAVLEAAAEFHTEVANDDRVAG